MQYFGAKFLHIHHDIIKLRKTNLFSSLCIVIKYCFAFSRSDLFLLLHASVFPTLLVLFFLFNYVVMGEYVVLKFSLAIFFDNICVSQKAEPQKSRFISVSISFFFCGSSILFCFSSAYNRIHIDLPIQVL